jgi:hypothetical protein
MRRTITLTVAAALLAACAGAAEPPSQPRAQVAIQDGISFLGAWSDAFHGPKPVEAMRNLADTGAGWIAIVIIWYQDRTASTDIRRTLDSPPDDELVRMIRLAHDLGLRVMLKPMVDLVRAWWNRPQIGSAFGDDQTAWDAWFASYRTFIFHYAEIAEAEGVEQFAVGTELVGTSGQVERWRDVVAGVRSRFSGTLTYASLIDGEEMAIRWWDAVDLIGIDVYWPLTDADDPTVEELEAAWEPRLEEMASLSSTWDGKPILFTEIGYLSIEGANTNPWAPWMQDRPIDLQEQADCYLAALGSVWEQPWFAGMYWWDWSANPDVGGPEDPGYTPFGKPAEDVLRAWYGAEGPPPSG